MKHCRPVRVRGRHCSAAFPASPPNPHSPALHPSRQRQLHQCNLFISLCACALVMHGVSSSTSGGGGGVILISIQSRALRPSFCLAFVSLRAVFARLHFVKCTSSPSSNRSARPQPPPPQAGPRRACTQPLAVLVRTALAVYPGGKLLGCRY